MTIKPIWIEPPKKKRFRDKLWELMRTRKYQIMIDIIRVVILIVAILILLELVTNIEAVKLLAYDPCKICMNQTGCICSCLN